MRAACSGAVFSRAECYIGSRATQRAACARAGAGMTEVDVTPSGTQGLASRSQTSSTRDRAGRRPLP